MFHLSIGRILTAAAILSAPLRAGDYDHLFDVVRDVWPERTLAMAICDKDASQLELIDLAETAKARNISLLIVDLKEEKDYNKTMAGAMSRNPGFVFIIDGDPIMGAKGHLTARMIYRATGRDIPTVGLSQGLLQLGAVLTAGPGAKDPVYASKETAARMKLALPEGAVDPTTKKKGK
ncbi:hypothetical protein [Mesoterricola silvestris]|uniref:Uncharacterized protein n=1 Tax=Mesoterricola silvestris TaxID=2927979 RepID=A0AA48GT50_9BACT|nr:hypothetical protein [Mesoterricola silvestris]BDU73830.1 hypothetical protein METEAL_30040 [Mesoterricola silvestris]